MRTDAQLIREAWDDPNAFAELYLRHSQPLYRWLRVRAPEPVAAELTAEAFAQAALGLMRFRDAMPLAKATAANTPRPISSSIRPSGRSSGRAA